MGKIPKKEYRKNRRFSKHRPKGEYSICPLCNRPIHTMSTAITHRETGKKAHFDCIIKELRREYHLKPNEDICYIGGGRFGIVDRNKKNRTLSPIKRKIQYEERSL